MSEHIDVVSRAQAWASKRGLHMDPDLVEEVVVLREAHDGLAAGQWPAGSVEHLLLVRWPGHGSRPPVPEEFASSLDTFWRFLRGQGLMSFESAPPKRLLVELRRAASRMEARYADPQAQGFNRQLLSFATQELGLDLQQATTREELEAGLDSAVEAWNALPMEERLRRSPRGSGPDPFGVDELSAVDLLAGADGEDDTGEDETIQMSDPAHSAPFAREAPFVRRMLALAEWVGDGRELTDRQVLRPALAKEAYRELGLEMHTRSARHCTPEAHSALADDPQQRRKLQDEVLSHTRSALDLPALDALWLAAEATGLVEIQGRRAVGRPTLPAADDLMTSVALVAGEVVLTQLRPIWDLPVVRLVLLALAFGEPERLTWQQLEETWWPSRGNLWGEGKPYSSRERSDEEVRYGVRLLADLGAVQESGGVLHVTPLGHDLALVMVTLIENGALDSGTAGSGPGR